MIGEFASAAWVAFTAGVAAAPLAWAAFGAAFACACCAGYEAGEHDGLKCALWLMGAAACIGLMAALP